jgi:hypothetical protein
MKSMHRTFAVRRRALSLCLCLGVALGASTAHAETENTFQSWTALFAQGRMSGAQGPSPAYWLDLQARRGSTTTVLLVRPGLGYLFDSRFSVWAGYAFIPTFVDGDEDRYEQRAWEQFMAVFKPGDSTWTLRTRAEQRFVVDADDVGHRFRQLVRLQQALTPHVAAVVWDEVFLAANDTDFGQLAGFDQNRAFVGPAWLPEPGVRLEAGYLSVVQRRPDVTTLVHALSVNAFLTF